VIAQVVSEEGVTHTWQCNVCACRNVCTTTGLLYASLAMR
jgi:hypothetical protein